ncbi:hypothetical protein BKA57DRAFT_2452 [Linnemannia elongata]|nr:hypothetical protein BKA57DRAFT_2452 [Linnemannia elongata]
MPHLFFLLFPLLCVVHCFVFVFVFVFVLSLPTKGRWIKDPNKRATGPLNSLAYGRGTSFLPLFQLLLPSSHGSPTRTHAHTHTHTTHHPPIWSTLLVLVFMFLLLVARAPLFDDLFLPSMSLFLRVDSFVDHYVRTATIQTRRVRIHFGLLFVFLDFLFCVSVISIYFVCLCLSL